MTTKVRVYNVSKGTDIVVQGEVADSFWARLKGLIGRRYLAPGEGLLIRPSKGVHMWFMRFPIDVIYVGDGERVIDVDEDLRPWTIGRPRAAARYVIEVPTGTVAATRTQPGDQLDIIPQAAKQR